MKTADAKAIVLAKYPDADIRADGPKGSWFRLRVFDLVSQLPIGDGFHATSKDAWKAAALAIRAAQEKGGTP